MNAHPTTDALAFDVYGTLVDPLGIGEYLTDHFDLPTSDRIAQLWRERQQEYTFRLTAMELYHDFAWVNRRALDQALTLVGEDLSNDERTALVEDYNRLRQFAEVPAALSRLRDAGFPLVVFSNGSPSMLAAITEYGKIREYFDDLVSVSEVGTYKPSPRAYRHVAERLGCELSRVCLVSANPVDNIGALSAGMRAAWVNRVGGPFDALGEPPDVIVSDLDELADALVA